MYLFSLIPITELPTQYIILPSAICLCLVTGIGVEVDSKPVMSVVERGKGQTENVCVWLYCGMSIAGEPLQSLYPIRTHNSHLQREGEKCLGSDLTDFDLTSQSEKGREQSRRELGIGGSGTLPEHGYHYHGKKYTVWEQLYIACAQSCTFCQLPRSCWWWWSRYNDSSFSVPPAAHVSLPCLWVLCSFFFSLSSLLHSTHSSPNGKKVVVYRFPSISSATQFITIAFSSDASVAEKSFPSVTKLNGIIWMCTQPWNAICGCLHHVLFFLSFSLYGVSSFHPTVLKSTRCRYT